MIRFLFINAFIGIHTIAFALWGIGVSFFDRTGRMVHCYAAVPWAKMILWVCGVQVKVEGLENLDAHGPRIYLSNHQSAFDIFALLAHLPVHFKFILKQELMKIPFLGQAMRRARYIAIDRADPRKALASMKEAAERVRKGASVLIFPEGTRSKDGRLQTFKKGGFHLALMSGCDLVPIVILNSRDINPKGSFRIHKGSFKMRIGKPISVDGYSKKDIEGLMRRVREAMVGLMSAGETAEESPADV
jgi:1-acyl-sn-glycerol-3-phosphate acyltransferase